jgi:UDP-glucose 4-epimerase
LIFCERLRRGAPVEVFGDGLQTRDFVAVSDVVAALRAAQRIVQGDAPVFNVCTGNATSIAELAHTIGQLAGVAADIRHAPPRAGEIRHSVGAADLSRRMLGLAPPVALRDGLRRVLDWLGPPG